MAQESATDLECRLAEAQRELSEAREQLAATAEVLRVISSSPTELQPVLEVVVKSAARFCGADADDVTIFELDGRDLIRRPTGARFRKLSAIEPHACVGASEAAPFSSGSLSM
jgi:hypothetical protein